ncbi:MAG: heavy metal translocating P-type ATPase, partial [Ruminococcus sp.]
MQEIIINTLIGIVSAASLLVLIFLGRYKKGLTKKQRKMMTRIFISSFLLFVFQMIPHEIFDGLNGFLFPSFGRWLRFVCYLAAYFIIGYDILLKAARGIGNRRIFDENFLMAAATIGAMVIAVYENGDYLEAIAVMLFYQIGEWFQSYAVGKSRRNISSLMDIRPDYANVEKDGKLEKIDPDEVEVGSVIVVMPGEKIPIDGTIIEGSTTLNTSALTGESLPREAKAGDEVISGCINMTGVLKIRTSKEF